MTLTKREIESQEIITEFNTKLQSFIISNTSYIGSTLLWVATNGAVGTVSAITGENNAKDPGAPSTTVLKPDISAVAAQTNSLRNVITTWMTIYSKTSRIRWFNYGNVLPREYNNTYRFTSNSYQVPAVISGTATLLDTYNVQSGEEMKRSEVQALIDSLQALWTTAARDVVTHTVIVNYCHSNCHSSRSRR